MATQEEKDALLASIHRCMMSCQEKASDYRLPIPGRNVFVTANIHLIEIGGKLYLRITILDSALIRKAIKETDEAIAATLIAHDQASIGVAAIQLSEAIWACYLVLNS